ncbi:hypothetical protein ElyMa_003799000 [Elysia marginata]|uniref:Uncharacterized protein n=1 Tax=Elysia marginata TaxID=1093978 RepID=A0AAV4FDS4_9GAST|nr:hypothetical protein ElyMa_003799000 [Elysia marginata]
MFEQKTSLKFFRSTDSLLSYKEKQLDELEQNFHRKLEQFGKQVKTKLTTASRDVAMECFELNETTALNSQKILGLRKLWKLKPRTSQVTTATTSSASSLASASATATSPGPIQSLSQRLKISGKAVSDVYVPSICDLKLLPGGLVLVTDLNNSCVKLFNTQGHFIDFQTLDGQPLRITILNPTSTCDWDVAVSLRKKCQIALIKVTQQRISFKTSITTSKPCGAIAAVDQGTLAVGYLSGYGIDLIDRSVHKVQDLGCISCHHQDGSTLIVDRKIHTLHVISPQGGWVKQVWSHPGGADKEGGLWAVSFLNDLCVCSTRESVFVLDVTH